MSQLTVHTPSAACIELLDVLKRNAKQLKKHQRTQKLAVCQDEIARSYGYANWSMLHKNVSRMAPQQFEIFAAQVVLREGVDMHPTYRPATEQANGKLKCRLFSESLDFLADEFAEGEAQGIVLAEPARIADVMERNSSYYYNPAKVEMHRRQLKKGLFEVPLVVVRQGNLDWIEGFHQVNAALEEDLPLIPIGTSLALAPALKQLVGAGSRVSTFRFYDFSECDATVV